MVHNKKLADEYFLEDILTSNASRMVWMWVDSHCSTALEGRSLPLNLKQHPVLSIEEK